MSLRLLTVGRRRRRFSLSFTHAVLCRPCHRDITGEKVVVKPNLPVGQGDLLPFQISQFAAVVPKLKDQFARVQRLEFVSCLGIVPVDAVFAIPQKRMSNMRHMSADLMSAPRDEFNFQQRVSASLTNDTVFGDDLLATVKRRVGDL